MGRFNRFLHLERERPAPKGPPAGAGEAKPDAETEPSESAQAPEALDPLTGGGHDVARAARFDAVETQRPAQTPEGQGRTQREGQEGEADHHGAAADPVGTPDLPRFESTPRSTELSLHLDRAEDQPFIRCRVCEGDSNRFARECQHCHADLDTPEQRAFNENLWATLRAQRVEEAEAHARAQAERLQAAEEEARQRRALYEQMARDVRRQTVADLDARLGERTVRWRGRQVKVGNARFQLAGLGVVVVVLLLFAGAFGSCRAAAGILPLALIAAGVIALRHFVRGR